MKLPERLSHLKHLIPTTCSEPKRKPSVFIYVIQCNDLIKVGIAGDVYGRLAELQVGNPYPLRVLGYWRAVNAIQEEEIIHVHLEKYRERGEWFRLPKDMLDKIAMKLPGYEMAQRIMPAGQFVTLRAALWRLNQSDYIKERGQRR